MTEDKKILNKRIDKIKDALEKIMNLPRYYDMRPSFKERVFKIKKLIDEI